MASRPEGRRRRLRVFVACVIVAGIAGVGLGLRQRGGGGTVAVPAGEERVMELAAVDVITVSSSQLQPSIPLSGSLRPAAQTVVKTKVAGELREVRVREGEAVRRGQVLATIDSTELDARLAEKRAALAAARAQRDLARKNWAMNEQLLRQNFISRNAADTVASALAVGDANVGAAEAQVSLARKALADAMLTAPMAGVVAERFSEPGEKLPVDARVLSLVDLSRMELEADVPASDIGSVRVGGRVEFLVEGIQGRPFEGRVERINPSADQRSRRIKVYIAVANPRHELRGGMFAGGTVASAEPRQATLVPAAVVRQDGGQDAVLVVEGGRVARRVVRLGARDGGRDQVEILEGLSPGERVITGNPANLRPGDRVRVAPGRAG